MGSLRLFAKKDILVVESCIKAGDEIRIAKVAPSGKQYMIVDMKDDLHRWITINEYRDLIEDGLVEIKLRNV